MYTTMTKCRQKLTWITLLLLCHNVSPEEVSHEIKEDLAGAEAKDGQLEIIKTIKKINEDGSYTIGYEADDGSFKIESRDVLGHVKGTYGYLDEDGEIKRVSYSTTNLTDILSEPPSVVQRIPKTNRTYSSTRKAGVLLYNPTTASTPTTTSVIQAIPKRRTTTQMTTTNSPTTSTTRKTDRPGYGEAARSTTSRPPNIVYATSLPPRNIIYTQRPLVRSTIAPQVEVSKSEGQLIRPEVVVTGRPTELPAFRRLALKNPLLENDSPTIKPVTEEPEVRGNLLRRQLSQEKPFDPRQHVINLQQSLGDDAVDVYSSSLTTGTPRTLFTTTLRPRILPAAQVLVEKPSPRYISAQSSSPTRYISSQSSSPVQSPTTTESYTQEAATTTEAAVSQPNTPPVPVYQIPQEHAQPEHVQQPLVAIRHPFHGGVVLVPFNQIRPHENHPPAHPQYFIPNAPYFREIRPTPTPSPEQPQNPAPTFIQRPPVLRSIPVQIDENGFVRPLAPQIVTTPYPFPVAAVPQPQRTEPRQTEDDIDIDNIRPPVSTKDFQKLIEMLIIRQARLEQANALINAQRQRELVHLQRLRGLPHPTPYPFLVRRPQEVAQSGPVTFIPEAQIPRTRQFITVPQTQPQQQQLHQAYVVRPQGQETRAVYVQEAPVTYTPAPTSFAPTKRVARLLHSNPPKDHEMDEEYLPTQIREMLLLRMLQLAINPALPLGVMENEAEASTTAEQLTKTGVRNVEVLGEEEQDPKRPSRSKRYRGKLSDYFE